MEFIPTEWVTEPLAELLDIDSSCETSECKHGQEQSDQTRRMLSKESLLAKEDIGKSNLILRLGIMLVVALVIILLVLLLILAICVSSTRPNW